MHQSQLSSAALLASLHPHSQSELSFDHSVSILWLYPFSFFHCKAIIDLIIPWQMLHASL